MAGVVAVAAVADVLVAMLYDAAKSVATLPARLLAAAANLFLRSSFPFIILA